MKQKSHPDFPVIDVHAHLYPDEIAAKVTPALAARFGNAPSFDGTVRACLAKDAECGICASVNLPVATRPDSVRHINGFWSERTPCSVASSPSPRVFSLAAFHPSAADKAGELERIAAAGFTGVKLHPEYQLFGFNDRAMDDAWAAMSELGLVAFLHVGGERVFRPPYHSTPADVAELQRRFPALTIVAAHLGGFGMWDEAEAMLVGTSVNLDLAHTFFWMPHEQIARVVRSHGPRRILFGTDAPWQDPGEVLEAFLSLPIPESDMRTICHDNAVELLRLPD